MILGAIGNATFRTRPSVPDLKFCTYLEFADLDFVLGDLGEAYDFSGFRKHVPCQPGGVLEA